MQNLGKVLHHGRSSAVSSKGALHSSRSHLHSRDHVSRLRSARNYALSVRSSFWNALGGAFAYVGNECDVNKYQFYHLRYAGYSDLCQSQAKVLESNV